MHRRFCSKHHEVVSVCLKEQWFHLICTRPFQQTFGCIMGSPVSATIINLEFIEERAISTAANPT